MTAREQLRLFSSLSGKFNDISGEEMEQKITQWMEEVQLTAHADKMAGKYSGGTKRKLGVAISMALQNDLVFLDEPSCGMDPDARRSLWAVILNFLKSRGSKDGI